jgi:hypothetical protein
VHFDFIETAHFDDGKSAPRHSAHSNVTARVYARAADERAAPARDPAPALPTGGNGCA